MENVVEMIEKREEKAKQGNWFPANGGTETPFLSRSGVRLLYVYQPSTGRHAYLNMDTDLVIPDDEVHLYLLMG